MSASRILVRFVLASTVGILLAWGVNELMFHFLKSASARAPQTIELVIPAGTADKIHRGDREPSIPDGLAFVVGDILVVRNDDSTEHELGPLFIPAGSTATMTLGTADKYSYQCSFTPDSLFGLDVQLAVTALTRLTGAVLAGLPLGMLIALYSLVAAPAKPKASG
jgi:hypothetical protein